jgi:hypothetical protein
MELEEKVDFRIAVDGFRYEVESWVQRWIGPGGLKAGVYSEVHLYPSFYERFNCLVGWLVHGPLGTPRMPAAYARHWLIAENGNITDTCIDAYDSAWWIELGNVMSGFEKARKHFNGNTQYMCAIKKYRLPRKTAPD